MASSPKYITIDAAADYYGVVRQTITKWIANGDLPAVKIGPRPKSRTGVDNRRVRIPVKALTALEEPIGVFR